MSFEMPTCSFKVSYFENSSIKIERANKSIYDKNDYVDIKKVFRTTQNNIVIPTGTLIKTKGTDIRILACISSIGYVVNCMEIGSNTRYVSVDKVKEYIGIIAKYLELKPKKVNEQINIMLILKTNKLELKWNLDEDDIIETRSEINYISGEFITLPLKKVLVLVWKM